jgi:hypothetical protein
LPTVGDKSPDVEFNGKNWVLTPGAILSVCTVVPAHEPWPRPEPRT